MRRAHLIGGIGGTAALATAAFLVALRRFSRRWIVPPRVVLDPPACEAFEEVSFTSVDGTPLYGWFLSAGPRDPGLVLCHGYQRAIEETFSIGCELRGHGFNVLLFDFRGCGRSGGKFTTIGHDEPRDARAAVNWLGRRLASGASIGMLGISMGGAVALTVAADCPQVSAVVTDSAFATLMGAVEQRFRGLRFPMLHLHRLTMRVAERMSGGRVAAVRPIDAARRLQDCPVLLIHGTADDIVPFDHALELDAALVAPHELWGLDGVNHAMARFRAREEYLTRVTGFFHRHLRVPARAAV